MIVFYVLTKKYYPLAQVYGGFRLILGGPKTILVPGPSAIFLRLKYNPATFAKTLDVIVAGGQGNQGGLGSEIRHSQHIHQHDCRRQHSSKRLWRTILIDAQLAALFQRPDARLPTWPCVGRLCYQGVLPAYRKSSRPLLTGKRSCPRNVVTDFTFRIIPPTAISRSILTMSRWSDCDQPEARKWSGTGDP